MVAVVLSLYGVIVWFSALLYAVLTDGPWGAALAFGPVIVSAFVLFALVLDWFLDLPAVRWLFRSLGTFF